MKRLGEGFQSLKKNNDFQNLFPVDLLDKPPALAGTMAVAPSGAGNVFESHFVANHSLSDFK